MDDHPSQPRPLTEASEATRRRWRAQQIPLAVAAFFFVGVIAFESVETKSFRILLAVLGTLLLMVIGFVAYSAFVRNPRNLAEGVLWRGTGTLRVRQLRELKLTDDLSFGSAVRLRFWAAAGVLSARMEVTDPGLRWVMRGTARLAGVRGSVFIPWSRITAVELGGPPGAIGAGKAGRYAVRITTGASLDGQFTGPRQELETQIGRFIKNA